MLLGHDHVVIVVVFVDGVVSDVVVDPRVAAQAVVLRKRGDLVVIDKLDHVAGAIEAPATRDPTIPRAKRPVVQRDRSSDSEQSVVFLKQASLFVVCELRVFVQEVARIVGELLEELIGYIPDELAVVTLWVFALDNSIQTIELGCIDVRKAIGELGRVPVRVIRLLDLGHVAAVNDGPQLGDVFVRLQHPEKR